MPGSAPQSFQLYQRTDTALCCKGGALLLLADKRGTSLA